MRVIALIAVLFTLSEAAQQIPYDLYVQYGGRPLPEKLRSDKDKWFMPESNSSTFIVGGDPADVSAFPYIISLKSGTSNSHRCGGSIINARTIVTAAHCTDGLTSFSVRYGSTLHASGGTYIQGLTKRQHPSYSSSTIDYDVATLISTVNLNGPTIGLASTEPADGSDVTVAGWGTLGSGGSVQASLRAVTVPIVNRATCQSNYGSSSITARMICAGLTQGGKDACQGDSGGPLVTGSGGTASLVGIVSWGRGCALAGYPGVYASVPSTLQWINDNSA